MTAPAPEAAPVASVPASAAPDAGRARPPYVITTGLIVYGLIRLGRGLFRTGR